LEVDDEDEDDGKESDSSSEERSDSGESESSAESEESAGRPTTTMAPPSLRLDASTSTKTAEDAAAISTALLDSEVGTVNKLFLDIVPPSDTNQRPSPVLLQEVHIDKPKGLLIEEL
jgi:hypothetical protein